MRGTQCIFNSAIALRRVFINSPIAAESLGQLPLQRILLPSLAPAAQRCSFATQLTYGPRPTEGDDNKKLVLPRDGDITAAFVVVRDEETGKLSEPLRPWDILGQLDPEQQSLVMVMDPTKMKGRSSIRYPICRIVDRKAELAAQKARENVGPGKGKNKEKELELNWAIAPNDLERSLRQLRTFLEKGFLVHVSLLKNIKRGKRAASDDEARVVLKKVQEAIKSIPGVRETKPMQGVLGRQVKLSIQGTKKASEVGASEVGASEVEAES
ncbi:hypothetical protein B0T16DRAFT_92348 [Cercophora newfieldiana]|uniref:Translation initiation factor 3 N-terminal domain-containing protein n=1 Tax=Cercophora newfieldiana TaxID=92897 RepID=A0AA39YJ64_9PEZI|nr:hypothetical protein B0T16DRAFT_92348 [Cercophora newfieldiana]